VNGERKGDVKVLGRHRKREAVTTAEDFYQ